MSARLDTLAIRLQSYVDCEAAILGGAQEYTIGGRRITRGNLQEVSRMIAYLEKEIANETSKAAGRGRNRMIGVIPRDL